MQPVSRSRTLPAALLLLAGASAAASAQSPRVHTLGAPEVEYGEAYSLLAGVRELRDGRVVVADAREKRLELVDLARGTATAIGREGSGPGEWRMPMTAFPWPGDSTLVHDPGNARFLMVDPTGKPGRDWRFDGEPTDMVRLFGEMYGTDAEGRVYFSDRGSGPAGRDGIPSTRDTATIWRVDPRTQRRDSVGWAALNVEVVRDAKDGTPAADGGRTQIRTVGTVRIPFSARDDWAVGADGRLAFVRAADYRVEWVAPNGQRVAGRPVPLTPVRVTEADKAEWRARASSGGLFVSARPDVAPMPRPAPREPDRWPAVKAPFESSARPFRTGALVASDGRLWVPRYVAAGEPPRYDVFDGFGAVVAQVVLPPDTRVLGFGARSVYLVRTDADDLQYLQRHRLPQ